MTASRFDMQANLALRVGVNLQRGQALVVRAPVDARPLVAAIAERAYRMGGGPVVCVYDDPMILRTRLQLADDAALDDAAQWLHDGIALAHEQGAARLDVLGPLPDLLDGIPIDRTIRLHHSFEKAGRREGEARSRVNASALLFATERWARRVFPTLDVGEAVDRLQAVIDSAMYADGTDSLSQHLSSLDSRCDTLNKLELEAIRLHGAGTDLTLPLVRGARWTGGTRVTADGVRFAPSLIAEDVRTLIDCHGVEGRLTVTRPISIAGEVIEQASFRFENGRAVSATAETGLATLEGLIGADAGAGRVSSVGLAPSSVPATRYANAFHNPVLDRTAGCHLRFGQPDTEWYPDGSDGDDNESKMGIDVMLGDVDADALVAGRSRALIRDGRIGLSQVSTEGGA